MKSISKLILCISLFGISFPALSMEPMEDYQKLAQLFVEGMQGSSSVAPIVADFVQNTAQNVAPGVAEVAPVGVNLDVPEVIETGAWAAVKNFLRSTGSKITEVATDSCQSLSETSMGQWLQNEPTRIVPVVVGGLVVGYVAYKGGRYVVSKVVGSKATDAQETAQQPVRNPQVDSLQNDNNAVNNADALAKFEQAFKINKKQVELLLVRCNYATLKKRYGLTKKDVDAYLASLAK